VPGEASRLKSGCESDSFAILLALDSTIQTSPFESTTKSCGPLFPAKAHSVIGPVVIPALVLLVGEAVLAVVAIGPITAGVTGVNPPA
jgi:hypothetical protein